MGTYTLPGTEAWEPTLHIAYIRVRYKEKADNPDKELCQMWRSTLGRTKWLAVPEIEDPAGQAPNISGAVR